MSLCPLRSGFYLSKGKTQWYCIDKEMSERFSYTAFTADAKTGHAFSSQGCSTNDMKGELASMNKRSTSEIKDLGSLGINF